MIASRHTNGIQLLLGPPIHHRRILDALRRIHDIANGAYVEIIAGMDEIRELSETQYP